MAFEAFMVIPGFGMSLLPQLHCNGTALPFLLLCFSSCRAEASGRKKGQMETRLCADTSAARQLGKWKTAILISQESMRCESLFPYSNYKWWLTFSGMFVFEWNRKFSPHYIDFTDILTPSVSYLPWIQIYYFTSYTYGISLIEIIKLTKNCQY